MQSSFHEMYTQSMRNALSKSIRQDKKSQGARKIVELVEDRRFVEMSRDFTKDNSALCRRSLVLERQFVELHRHTVVLTPWNISAISLCHHIHESA